MDNFLFSEVRLSELELGNRIVVSPMGQFSATEDGCATLWHKVHIGSLVVGGPGLVIMEATAIEPRGRVSNACLGIWGDHHVDELKKITSFAGQHSHTRVGIQLAHSGRKGSTSVPWKGRQYLSKEEGGWQTVSPSTIPYPGKPEPRALDEVEMQVIKKQYGEAAVRARKSGFDLLELHCAHGYLLHSYLSPLANDREDGFGGTLDKRMRFPLEVFEETQANWPKNKPIGVRISATDWVEGGWTIEDSLVFARHLEQMGCSYIAVSSGGMLPKQRIPINAGYQVSLAAELRRAVSIPIIAVGLIKETLQAESIIATGQADLVAMGRTMICDPRWVWRAAAELGHPLEVPQPYDRAHPANRYTNWIYG